MDHHNITGRQFGSRTVRKLDFHEIAQAAKSESLRISRSLISNGKKVGSQWVGDSPLPSRHTSGYLKVNLETGKWCDFASDARGGDLISLAAYCLGSTQKEAALFLAEIIGGVQ